MGALIAIRTPYPVHLALDNKSVVAVIRDILAGQDRSHIKPWQIRNNGDIYNEIDTALKQR